MPLPALVKQAASPGSIGFAILCISLWALLVLLHRQRLAAWVLALSVSFYLVLAMPSTASLIVRSLPPFEIRQPDIGHLDTLVVFDGDNRVGRSRASMNAYETMRPSSVVVIGEPWLVDALVAGGISADKVISDESPATTRDQVVWMKRRKLSHPTERTAVVASCLQMPRVAGLIEAAGLTVGLLPSPVDDLPTFTGPRRFAPSYLALRMGRDAIYEHAALAYYRWRGWIPAPLSASASSSGTTVLTAAACIE